MPNLLSVEKTDTFEQWRQKTNSAITDLNSVWGGGVIRLRSNGIDVDYDNNDVGSVFTVSIDGTSNIVLSIDPLGNMTVTKEVTATKFNGPVAGNVTGNLTGNVTGDLTGDVYASNGTSKVLENGNGTTVPAVFTGNVTGNLTGDSSGTHTGSVVGNASSATKLATVRSLSITGDATWTVNFDGTGNATGALTLANSGVTAATYTKVTVDSKGRITSGGSIASSDVTTALGFTPLPNNGKAVDSALLNGYTDATTATANTIVRRDASGDISVNNLYGTAQFAKYADLAEKYLTDKEYKVGTVMIVASGLVTAECTQSYATGQFAIGVISDKPAFLMNSESEGQAIALKGRVPVRVVGQILKGQPIMSTHDGLAIAGAINTIGIALETNMDIGEKLVECIIL